MTKTDIKERNIVAYLKKRVTEAGGIYRKVSWEGRADAPDYLIMCGGLHIFTEVKAPGETPRPSQMREFAAMLEHGGLLVCTVSTFRDVEALIRSFQTCQHSRHAHINQS